MPTVPKVRATKGTNDSGSVTTFAATGPATVTLGDLLLDVTATDPDAGTTSNTAITPASGWSTVFASSQASGHGAWIKVFAKVAVAADVATGTAKTYTFGACNGSQTVHNIMSIYDYDNTSAFSSLFNVAPIYNFGTGTRNIPSPAITPTADATLVLALWAANQNTSGNSGDNLGYGTLPSPWVQQVERAGSWERTVLGSISAPTKNTAIASAIAALSGGTANNSSWGSLALAIAGKPDAVTNPDLPGRFLIGAAA